MRTVVTATMLLLAASGAAAQTVYRCSNSYSQEPCPGGRAVDVSDKVLAGDAKNAGRAAASDQKRADALEKARLEQEKNAPKAVVIGPATPPVDAKPAEKKKDKGKSGGKPEHFTAKAPAPKKD